MKELTLLFLIKDDQLLLAMKKRGFGVGRWNGVGGKIEPGETVEQALVREAHEEIAVTPVVYEKVAEITFHENDGQTVSDMLVHVYTCGEWQGVPMESEEMAPQWFLQTELPFHTMWPDDPFWLPQILAGEHLKANFSLDSDDHIINKEVIVLPVNHRF